MGPAHRSGPDVRARHRRAFAADPTHNGQTTIEQAREMHECEGRIENDDTAILGMSTDDRGLRQGLDVGAPSPREGEQTAKSHTIKPFWMGQGQFRPHSFHRVSPPPAVSVNAVEHTFTY